MERRCRGGESDNHGGYVVKKWGETTLEDCPIGLFSCGGELCLKTEYGDNNGRIDAYIVSSGEFFWGGAKNPTEQRHVAVWPLEVDSRDRIRHRNGWR